MATEAEVAAAQIAEQGTQQTPAADPAAETAKLREENERLQKQYDEIRKVETRNSQEIARLKKQGNISEDEEDPTSEEAQKRKTDLKYLKGLGFMSSTEVEEELTRREDERERERQVHTRAQQIKADMDENTEKYKFIQKSELLDFMKQRPGLSVMEAAKLKYESEFDKLKNLKDVNAPETDSTGKGGFETPVRKMISFKNRGKLSSAIGETAKQAAAIQ